MHNLLLGTGKYLMAMWKDSGILTKAQFEYIQQEIDGMKVPANVGRIPYKIASVVLQLTNGKIGYVSIPHFV